MAHKVADRVKETASTTGTGTFTLAGAVSGFDTFASFLADGDTTWYCAVNGAEWEVGVGTRMSSTTLARSVQKSSNSNALVNFTAPPEVFCTIPAGMFRAGAPLSPDSPPIAPNVADDEFDGAALDTTGTRAPGATPWAWRNQGSATASLAQGALSLHGYVGSSTDVLHLIEQSLPVSGTWKYRTKLLFPYYAQNDGGGFGLVASGTGKIVFLQKYRGSAATDLRYALIRTLPGTSRTAPVDAAFSALAQIPSGLDFHVLEVEWDGTNYIFRMSRTGMDGTFVTIATENTTFLGTADKIALVFGQYSTTPSRVIVDWFRRIA